MTAHRHLNSDEKNRSTTHALFGPPKPAAFVPGCRPLQHRDKETQKLSVGPGSLIMVSHGEGVSWGTWITSISGFLLRI